MGNIILNIPHSSVNGIFDKEIGGWHENPFFINGPVREHTDWFTDMLFTIQGIDDVIPAVFNYSRFVCDVERLENDPMEKQGQGIIYDCYEGYVRRLNPEMRERIFKLREDHLSRIVENISDNGSTVLIDCHSFTQADEDAPDIYIGFNGDFSYDERIVDLLLKEFNSSGYSTALNKPYANTLTLVKDKEYKSVMIEVNKRIYLDAGTLLLNPNPRQWMRWYGCLGRIYRGILAM